MQQLTEFVLNNLLLFAALLVVMVMLVKAELDHQANKGLLLSTAGAIRLMNNHSDALVLDLRAAADYKTGHIKGAKSAPMAELKKNIDKFADSKDKPVLVYCNTGNSATAAIRLLKQAGFAQINNLEGGIAAWKEANMPLSTKSK